MSVAPFARTLDQELAALVRGASLECLVCGEFVLRLRSADTSSADTSSADTSCADTSCVVACPECRSLLVDGTAVPEIELPSVVQAG